jgi:hypothetical protein
MSPAGSGALGAGAGGKLGGTAGANSAGASVGGRAGSAGSAATAGRGGAGSSAGSVGSSGGAPPVFEPGACAETPTLSLSYQESSKQDAQITAQYQFINTSDTPVGLGSLSIRYFFSSEETSAWTPSVYSAQLDGGTGGYRPVDGAKLKVIPLGTKAEGADTYAELTFPAGITLEKGATAKVSWDLQPANYGQPNQVQSNDYSYNAADTAFMVWDHVVIYQDTTLVWGCLPKAADGDAGSGAGGSSGASGSGASGASGAGGGPVGGGGAVAAGGTVGSVTGGGAGAPSTAGAP